MDFASKNVSYQLVKDSDRAYKPDAKTGADVIFPFDGVAFNALSTSSVLQIVFRLRLVKTGMGKAIVKPRKPYVVTREHLIVEGKSAYPILQLA